MKENFHKIAALSMAFMVLFSTMSFSLDMHYCGDHLVDFSFTQKVDTCLMKAEMSKTSTSCSMMDMKMEMDCCSDVEVVFEGQEELKISFDQFSFEQQMFVATFIFTYINRFWGVDENIIPFKDYAPPPLIRDVQVLHQTFLI